MAHADTLMMIERFMSFDTVSRNSNLPLIQFARTVLEECGAEVSLTFDGDGRKANLLASIGGRGEPGLLLSGHTDVVPVEDQDWSVAPFAATQREGRIYGRGTCDMKGFLAIATATAIHHGRAGIGLPLHIAMSYDEEVGCLGVHDLIDDIIQRLAPPRLCIVGEPTEMAMVYAHKGKVGGHVTVKGLNAHSSLSHIGVNAVEAASEAVAFLKSMQRKARDSGPFNAAFEDPKYTSIQACMISGGTAVNVIPSSAAFDFDIRYLPGEDPETYLAALERYIAERLHPEMQAIDPSTGLGLQRIPGCAAFWQDPASDAVSLVHGLLPGKRLIAVPFGTEAGYFRDAGIPTVVCGPGCIDQAHKPDEFVTMDQVDQCENFLDRLIRTMAA